MTKNNKLAILGGEKAVKTDAGDMFKWPIITSEDEEAVLQVLHQGTMSKTDITKQFEKEIAEWIGLKYALCCCNGTAAVHSAMWACGVNKGSEVIAQSITYWATALPALNLRASVNFADIDPDTLTIDPDDIEHRINKNTKAIVVVHSYGHPADMDSIMAIARKHNIKVIEDVSHAQGGLYKGRKLGTIGDVGVFSMMAGKSLAIGEGGALVTNNRTIYEYAVAFGHYERTGKNNLYSDAAAVIADKWLVQYREVPLGGCKYRMNQTCSAMGRVQLKYYDQRCEEIRKAMNYFWDLLEGVKGIKPHRPSKESNSNMGGWYAPKAFYSPEELRGLPVEKFCEAVRAEGVRECSPGVNLPLHLHPISHTADIYGDRKPTILANTNRDIRQGKGTLPVSEGICKKTMQIPWFKHYRPQIIEEHALAFKKVAENFNNTTFINRRKT